VKFQKREVPKSEGGGLFLRLEDGESKVGVFRGEIYEFFQYWEGNKSHVVTADHPKAKSRFRLNFVTKEEGVMQARIFEFPTIIYNQLAELSEEYDLEKTAVKITRRGVGIDTVYMIIPAKDQPSPAQLKAIQAIDLAMLEHKEHPQAKPKNYAPGADDDGSDIPF
jgi:hypothetical protein